MVYKRLLNDLALQSFDYERTNDCDSKNVFCALIPVSMFLFQLHHGMIKLYKLLSIIKRPLEGRIMVFNATINNISVISCRSVLLVEETGVPGENSRHATSQWQLYHIMLYQWMGFKLTMIGTDCTGSCKSNFQTIKTMTAPIFHRRIK